MTEPVVTILLATCEGAKWLPEQWESLLRQRHVTWRCIARDDASTDGTADILLAIARRWPDRLILLNGEQRLGTKANFAQLVTAAISQSATLVAFCDQDDIWHHDRLATGVKIITSFNDNVPILVHSNLAMMDSNGKPIGRTIMHDQRLDPKKGATFAKQLCQSCAWGNTMLINSELLRLASPIPNNAVMHDWWIALVASAFGKTIFIPLPLVNYRIHSKNVSGIGGFHNWSEKLYRYRSFHQASIKQAQAFINRFHNLPYPSIRIAKRFVSASNLGLFNRQFEMLKSGHIRHDWRRILMDLVIY